MHALVTILVWLAITATATGLAWLYGSSWRALARAIGEAERRAALDGATSTTTHRADPET